MEKYNKRIGGFGEDFAANVLQDKGYRIIARNYRLRSGEIDIIALYEDMIVFVEVKTRSNLRYGSGMDYITPSRANKKTNAAFDYISDKIDNWQYSTPLLELQPRFDVFDIIGHLDEDGRFTVSSFEHIESAFY